MEHSMQRAHWRVRAEAVDEPSGPQLVNQMRRMLGTFTDFRTRNDARLEALETAQDELNRRVALAAITPGDVAPGRGRLSNDARQELLSVLRGHMPQRAASVGSDPDGGYLLGVSTDPVILPAVRELSVMRQLATVATIDGAGSWRKVVNRIGASSGWANENTTRTETNPAQLGLVEIFPSEQYALPKVSNHLLDDAGFDVEAFLTGDVAAEFAAGEGAAFVVGNGTNRPRGLFTYATSTDDDSTRAFGTYEYVPTGVSGGFVTGGSPSASPADVLVDLVAKLKPAYRANAAWMMNPTTTAVLRKFKDADGRFILVESLQAGNPPTLLGYPLYEDENVPVIAADSLSIAFGDFARGYAIVDKPNNTRLIVDRVTEKGWTYFYFTRRLGGAGLDSSAVKFLKFGTS